MKPIFDHEAETVPEALGFIPDTQETRKVLNKLRDVVVGGGAKCKSEAIELILDSEGLSDNEKILGIAQVL